MSRQSQRVRQLHKDRLGPSIWRVWLDGVVISRPSGEVAYMNKTHAIQTIEGARRKGRVVDWSPAIEELEHDDGVGTH